MTLLLIVSLSTQVEAKIKKTSKPTVKVVNGTVIVNLKNAINDKKNMSYEVEFRLL